ALVVAVVAGGRGPVGRAPALARRPAGGRARLVGVTGLDSRAGVAARPVVEAGVVAVVGLGHQRLGQAARRDVRGPVDLVAVDDRAEGARRLVPLQRGVGRLEGRVGEIDALV